VLFLILYDAWSYFWHVAYHRINALYRVSHHVHHLSVVTTPWTTFQGSPIELLPATLFTAIVAAMLPLATPVLVVIMVATLVYTMMQHGGLEFFPRGTATHPLGRWIVTPTYHQMHHEDGNRNIALYFNWWDRLMGTKNAGYEARFEKVTASAAQRRAPSPESEDTAAVASRS
jgi:sterol desaturase/sphingolipid hydroxylase (fatty acid hydroxylase superfamily)